MRILGIAGSLREGSYNRQLLQLAGENLPDGVEFAVWEGLAGLPAYNEDEEGEASARRRRLPLSGRSRGCRPDRDARVQRLHPGSAEERARLGLAAARRLQPSGASPSP